MSFRSTLPLLLLVAILAACSDMGNLGGTKYGESDSSAASTSDRNGTITQLKKVQVDENYKLGVGTAAGAIAGGILGSQLGDSTTATVAGAALGGAAGTYAESKIKKKNAQQVTVNMKTGGHLTILQPEDPRLKVGMHVRIEGGGENARVVPQ
ncbi:hypothetical protein GALL_388160 [mine drainage metagenome]|uniref:Glycine zipper 2TM domain-containing protein n=1 Tax=mine drainage metagenome TaxID=410659 RepID=A0A1J5Q8D5_9ZZZZ